MTSLGWVARASRSANADGTRLRERYGPDNNYPESRKTVPIGYCALAVGALARGGAPGRSKRHTPDPIPVMVLARLAIDPRFQSRGIGPALLRDAVLRTLQASEIAGSRAILVHPISERARQFYEEWGFVASPVDPITLMIAVTEAARELVEKSR